MTATDAALNAVHLLEVARGEPPPRNAALKDYPIAELGPIASMDPRLTARTEPSEEWTRTESIEQNTRPDTPPR